MREGGNPTEVVPRTILPRLPEVTGEHFTEYPARVLLPMDRRKKVHLTIGGMTMDLEPYPFSHFPRTNSGQPRWVLAPPLVATAEHEPLFGSEQVTADPQNKGVVPGKTGLTGRSSMVQGASLPDWEEPKGVEVTVENPPTHAEALEPKPELLRTELDREESSVSMVPDYCQDSGTTDRRVETRG